MLRRKRKLQIWVSQNLQWAIQLLEYQMGHWWLWTQLIYNTCGNRIGNGRWKSQFIFIINCCYYLVVKEWAAKAVGGGLGYIKGLIKANIATPLREPDRPLTNDARRHRTCVTQTRSLPPKNASWRTRWKLSTERGHHSQQVQKLVL